MKKVIVTENQIKSLLNNLVTEQATPDNNFMKGVQHFLNVALKLNPPLVIDGKTGSGTNTEKAIMKYQTLVNVWPVDGVWGEDTMKKMTPKHKEAFDKIQLKYADGFDQVFKKIFK